jgi:hypothetical protein
VWHVWEVQKFIQEPEPEGKRQLGRQRRKWEDNIKFDFKEDWLTWTGFIWFI